MIQLVECCAACDRVLGPAGDLPLSNDPGAFRFRISICTGCRAAWTRKRAERVLAHASRAMRLMRRGSPVERRLPPLGARLFDAIKHGDAKHRRWLRKVMADFFAAEEARL